MRCGRRSSRRAGSLGPFSPRPHGFSGYSGARATDTMKTASEDRMRPGAEREEAMITQPVMLAAPGRARRVLGTVSARTGIRVRECNAIAGEPLWVISGTGGPLCRSRCTRPPVPEIASSVVRHRTRDSRLRAGSGRMRQAAALSMDGRRSAARPPRVRSRRTCGSCLTSWCTSMRNRRAGRLAADPTLP